MSALSEWLLVAAMTLSLASGLPGLFLPRTGRAGERLFVALMTLATLCACAGAIGALGLGWSRELSAPWAVPGGRFALRVDAVSAMFVLQIALLSGLGAWYGLEYWAQADHPTNGRKLRAFFGAVTAGMLLLVVARNAVLFLAGWEIMAASAFILVSTEDEHPPVREVGYLYLLSTRFGTLCLFAMFALLGAASGTLDLDGWPRALASPFADAIFVLGLLGFGLKAGIMPLHVWLPGAHSSAPSHVSAVMSGVLIKTGIYGLVRLTAAAGAPPPWWGHTLLAAGVISGVLGVAFAIGQHDLKRLLAYHSVENIGIICLGLGIALLGRSADRPELIVLGIAGAMLHVWNHGLFKALLFFSAGSIVHATGTREIDRLGGLWRRMPRTGLAFLIGAVAICGLPPLNGLVSELFVYLGLFRAGTMGGGLSLAGMLSAAALVLVGGLALACFVKVFGAVFLGRPRSPDVDEGHDPGAPMLAPMVVLAAGCLVIGLGSPLVAGVLDQAVAAWAGGAGIPARAAPPLAGVAPLGWISIVGGALLVVLLLFGWLLAARARAQAASTTIGTWDCGYAAPAPRAQYSSSSFAQLLVAFLGWALRPHVRAPRIDRPFPAAATFHSHVPDTVLDRGLAPAFSLAGRFFARLRPIQQGSVHLYLLYILGTLFALLLWR